MLVPLPPAPPLLLLPSVPSAPHPPSPIFLLASCPYPYPTLHAPLSLIISLYLAYWLDPSYLYHISFFWVFALDIYTLQLHLHCIFYRTSLIFLFALYIFDFFSTSNQSCFSTLLSDSRLKTEPRHQQIRPKIKRPDRIKPSENTTQPDIQLSTPHEQLTAHTGRRH